MFHTDGNALDHARRLVEEALAVLMRGITPKDQPRARTPALRQSRTRYGRRSHRGLVEVAIGEEERLSDDLRRVTPFTVEDPERAAPRRAAPSRCRQ
jgi:hypothetical protein